MKNFFLILFLAGYNIASAQDLCGFNQWIAGQDSATVRLFPKGTSNCLSIENGQTIAKAKFIVRQYGEMSFPLNPSTLLGAEALPVDLSHSKFIEITYKASCAFVVQLREFAVHGGIQNSVGLPASENYTTKRIPFSQFTGGLKPLDMKNAAKVNFAFLKNNEAGNYSEIRVKAVRIDNYRP